MYKKTNSCKYFETNSRSAEIFADIIELEKLEIINQFLKQITLSFLIQKIRGKTAAESSMK